VFRVFPVIPAAEIVQECKQRNDPGVCPGFFSQAEAILSDPYPMAHAVDTVPVKGVGSVIFFVMDSLPAGKSGGPMERPRATNR